MSSKPIHSYQSNILHSDIEYIQHQLSHLHSTFDSFYHFLNPLAWLGNYRGVILTNEKAEKHFQKHPLKLISNSNELQGIVSIIKNGNLEEYKSIMSKLKIGQYVLFQVKNEIPDFFFSKENSLPVFIAGLNYTYEQKEKSFSVLSRGIRIHSLNWNKCFDSINSTFRTLSDFSNFFDSNNFHSNKPIVLLVCSSKPNHIKEFFGIHYNKSRNSVGFYLNENKDKIQFNVVENEKNWTEYQSIHILESFPDNFDAKSQITIIFNAHQNNIVLDENKYYIFWIGYAIPNDLFLTQIQNIHQIQKDENPKIIFDFLNTKYELDCDELERFENDFIIEKNCTMGKFNYLKNNLIEDNGKYSIIVFQPETRFIAQHLIYNIVNDLFNVTNLRNNVHSKDIFPLFFIIDKEPRPFLLNSNFLVNFDEKLKHIYSSILCPICFNIAHPINLKYLSIIIKDILNSSQNKRHDDIQKGIDRILKFIKFGFLQICDQKEISKHFQNILYKIRSVDESTNINLEQDFINAIRNSFQDHAETFIWCFFLANDSFQSFEAIKSFLEFVKNEKFMIEIPTNRNCRLSYFSKSKFHKKPIPLTLLRKYEASYQKYIENYIENHLNIDYGLNRKKEVGQTKYKNMYHVILSNNIKFPICNDIISHPCLIRVNEPKERDFQITFIHALNGLAGIIINYDKYGNSLYLDNFEDIKKNIVNLLAFSYPTLTELQCNLVYSQMKFIDKDASDYQYFNNVLTLENFHQQVFENNMKNKMHKIKRKSQFLFASFQFFKLNSLEMCFTEKYFDTENYKQIHLDSIITNDNIQEIQKKFRNDKIPQKNSSRYSIGIFDFYLTRSIFDVIQEKIFQKNQNFSDPFIDWFFSDQPLIVHQFQSLIYAIIDNNVNSNIIWKELGLLSSLINPWIFYDYSPIREFWYAFMELLNTKDFDISNINQISIKHVQLIFSKIPKPWIDNIELCLPYSTYVDMKLPNTKTIMNYIFNFAVFYESEKRIDLLEIFKILPFVHHTQSLIIFHKFAKFLKNVFKEQENLISILLKTFQCNSLLSIGKLMNNLLPYQQIEQYIEESNLYFDIKELIYSKDSIQDEEDQKKIEGINILNLFPQSDKSLEKSLKLAHEKWPLNDSATQIKNYLNESTKIHNKLVDCFNKISNKTVNLSDDNEIEKHVIFNASFSNLIVSFLSTAIHSIKSENNVVIDTLVSDIKSANFGEFIHTKYYLDSYDRIWNCGLDYLFDPLFSPQIANRFTERDLLQVFSKLHTLEIEEKVDVFRCLLMIFEFPGDFYPFSFESIHLKGRKLTASQLTKDICLKAQIEIGRKGKETVAFELVGKAVQILKIKNILI